METIKNAVAVLAGIVGLVTGLLTLYAKYLDVKKSADHESEALEAQTPEFFSPPRTQDLRFSEPAVGPVVSRSALGRPSIDAIERSREAVKAPATTLLAAGLVSFFFNLFIAGFGYVDQFVTPLTTETQNKRAFMDSVRNNPSASRLPTGTGTTDGLSDDATVVLTICTTLSLSIASAAAAWAGYGMLRLRSYWLSVAGSFAIMAGGLFCCMGGLPIGIWSLSVLYKPEVAASFR